MLALSGCISTERPDLAVDIPPAYRTAHGMSPAGRPALDWWRGFRSAELTKLVEEAESANFDIAAAVARITQADAQSKIVGATLLPAINLNSTAARSRSSQANGGGGGGGGGSEQSSFNAVLNASSPSVVATRKKISGHGITISSS